MWQQFTIIIYWLRKHIMTKRSKWQCLVISWSTGPQAPPPRPGLGTTALKKSKTLARPNHEPSISPGLARFKKQIKFLKERINKYFKLFQITIFNILRLMYSHLCVHVNKYYKHTPYKQGDATLIPSLQMCLLMDLVLPIYRVPVCSKALRHWLPAILFACLYAVSANNCESGLIGCINAPLNKNHLSALAGWLGKTVALGSSWENGGEGEAMPVHYLHQGWCSRMPIWATSCR